MTLLIQGEHDRYWGILPEHLELDDPPVHSWAIDHFVKGPAWLPPTLWSATTTGFALRHLLLDSHPGPAGRLVTWVSAEEAAQITADLTATMANRFELDGLVLFEDTDAIARINRSGYGEPDEPRPFEVAVHLGDHWRFPMPPSIKTLVGRGGAINGYFWQLREEYERQHPHPPARS